MAVVDISDLYPYVADTANGFLLWTPEVDDLYAPPDAQFVPKSSLVFDAATDNIVNAQQCAARCLEENAPSGAWNSRLDLCFCYLVEASSLCKEPCIQEEGVEFSTLPIDELGYCEKSFCDEDWYYDAEYCDMDLGFDEEACGAKIQELMNATVPASSPIGPIEPEGIEINQCSDTLALFGDSDPAKAFSDVVSCSCTGDLTASYTMECKVGNYCFDWYTTQYYEQYPPSLWS